MSGPAAGAAPEPGAPGAAAAPDGAPAPGAPRPPIPHWLFGLAVMWDRRLKGGRTVTGLPAAMTGARASRISAIALVVSTVALGAVLVLLLGAWALVAIPPLALSLVSAWLMARTPV